MNSSIWFLFALLAFATAQTKQLDPGPQTLAEETASVQNQQKRATKEVIVYLTPSQIKALREGNGYLNAEGDQEETSQDNQGEVEQLQPEEQEQEQDQEEEEEQDQEEEQEQDSFPLGSLEVDPQLLQRGNQVPSSIPVEEPASEEQEEPDFSWLYRPPQGRKFIPSPEDEYAYLRYFPETETQTEAAQLEPEENEEENEEAQPEGQQQQRYKLVPYDYVEEKSEATTTAAPEEEPIRERWLRLLEQNRAQLKKAQEKLSTTTTTTEQSLPDLETTLARLRFSARYNDQKKSIEKEESRKNILEKQKALIRAEERANQASASKEANKQAPIIKRVKVHTPVLVPIPEPFEVKVPHPFPVPLEIFRPISRKSKPKKAEPKKTAATRTEEKPKTTTKKPAPTTEKAPEERRQPVDSKKEVTVEVPTRQKGQPERITIIRHIWEN